MLAQVLFRRGCDKTVAVGYVATATDNPNGYEDWAYGYEYEEKPAPVGYGDEQIINIRNVRTAQKDIVYYLKQDRYDSAQGNNEHISAVVVQDNLYGFGNSGIFLYASFKRVVKENERGNV